MLSAGGVFEEMPTAQGLSLSPGVARIEVAEPLLEGDGEWSLVAHPSPLLYDGRGANLPWLQEVPDPVTKIGWQSWVEVSNAVASRLGVEFGDVLAVETPFGRFEAPVVPRGALRDDVVAVAIGQGHTVGTYASRGGKTTPGEPRGVNVIAALPAATDESGGRAWLSTRAKLSKTGRSERVAIQQKFDNQRERQLGEAVPVAVLAAAPPPAPVSAAPDPHATAGHGAADGHAAAGHGAPDAHGGHAEGHHEMRIPFDAALDARPDLPHRWGMTVDLDRCTGCSACVVACYVENNIPVVGEDQVIRGRVMSWIRIERFVGRGEVDYVTGRPPIRDRSKLGDVDVRHLPLMCQQCGAAPCEPVCPVIATYHNDEGLNGMAYNRCIGTRYCANNCPYKVRRFNYFDYAAENSKFPYPMNIGLNPDVTVRGQGVMEKCTFCVQRIALGRQTAKDLGRAVADGEVTTACAQSCPTDAIVFGNLRDENSRAVAARQGSRPRLPRAARAQHPSRGHLPGEGDPRPGRGLDHDSASRRIRRRADATRSCARGLGDQPRPPGRDGQPGPRLLGAPRVLRPAGPRRRGGLGLPGLRRPRDRRLRAPDLLGRLHRHLRVLGRYRPRRNADLGHPLPVPVEVAKRDQPQRGGDDGLRGPHRRPVPRDPRRADVEVAISSCRTPTSAGCG